MRIGVVTTGYGDGWREDHIVVRRLAGALACVGEVDLMVAAGPSEGAEIDGAMHVLRFPAEPTDTRRQMALQEALFGPSVDSEPFLCGCTERHRRAIAADLPRVAQRELLDAGGGRSPALLAHLRRSPYDMIVFAGVDHAATHDGIGEVDDACRVVVAPLARGDQQLALPVHDAVFERADAVVVSTETEAALVRARGVDDRRLHNVRFVLRVHQLARRNIPFAWDHKPTVVIARDWSEPIAVDRLLRWKGAIEGAAGGRLGVRFIGPSSNRLGTMGLPTFTSRLDVWRWVSRAVALVDPEPHRLLGREVLEAMQYGTPVVVTDHGGATREHAEAGDGGLWYHTYEHLEAAVLALFEDEELRADLGRQGAAYAESVYGDSEDYLKRVDALVQSLA